MHVDVIADESHSGGGYVVERLRHNGAVVQFADRASLPDRATHVAAGVEPDLLLLLGSERSAHDPVHVHDVMAESRWVRESLAAGVPVMGIGFGAQLMARALGGHSYRMNDPEFAWARVDTIDPVLCPPGPWAHFHRDTLVPPQNARVLGSTWYGPQCFVEATHGARCIGWQFHPEVEPDVYAKWIRQNEALVRAQGIDSEELIREARRQAPQARTRAFALVDAAVRYLSVPTS